MSDPDHLLRSLWTEDEPPRRDPAFVLEVMEAASRRRLLENVLALAPLTVAAAAVLWALGPVIGAGLAAIVPPVDGQVVGEVAAALTMSAFLWGWVSGRLGPLRA